MKVNDGRLAQELGRSVLVVVFRIYREDVSERKRYLFPTVFLELDLPVRTNVNARRSETGITTNYSKKCNLFPPAVSIDMQQQLLTLVARSVIIRCCRRRGVRDRASCFLGRWRNWQVVAFFLFSPPSHDPPHPNQVVTLSISFFTTHSAFFALLPI